jgi:hypothetical protein
VLGSLGFLSAYVPNVGNEEGSNLEMALNAERQKVPQKPELF